MAPWEDQTFFTLVGVVLQAYAFSGSLFARLAARDKEGGIASKTTRVPISHFRLPRKKNLFSVARILLILILWPILLTPLLLGYCAFLSWCPATGLTLQALLLYGILRCRQGRCYYELDPASGSLRKVAVSQGGERSQLLARKARFLTVLDYGEHPCWHEYIVTVVCGDDARRVPLPAIPISENRDDAVRLARHAAQLLDLPCHIPPGGYFPYRARIAVSPERTPTARPLELRPCPLPP